MGLGELDRFRGNFSTRDLRAKICLKTANMIRVGFWGNPRRCMELHPCFVAPPSALMVAVELFFAALASVLR